MVTYKPPIQKATNWHFYLHL